MQYKEPVGERMLRDEVRDDLRGYQRVEEKI
jgi:hypothetical protein